MKSKSGRGGAPGTSGLALLLIDVINDMEFPQGRQLLKHALPAAQRIRTLKRRARDHGIPCIYTNDNFGRWKSDFRAQVDHCRDPGVIGHPVAEILPPEVEDYFVLKPKHSAFHSTTLEPLLRHLEVRSLILTGFASDICVLFTANDAYMRDYELSVPPDCIAAETDTGQKFALQHMKRYLRADVRASKSIRF